MTTAVPTALLDRVATAPISWGVCEVPGWGYQLPVHRVLAEMGAAGFSHTELGSWGYLPTEPTELRTTLDGHGLGLLGGFAPLVLHDPSRAESTRAAAHRWARLISRWRRPVLHHLRGQPRGSVASRAPERDGMGRAVRLAGRD